MIKKTQKTPENMDKINKHQTKSNIITVQKRYQSSTADEATQ